MNISSPEWKPQPPARKGDPISLHTLPSRDFERLCGELFAIEPGVESCELYGVGGQEQYGIDLLARETDAIHIQVGQCKCYESFTVKDIKDASTKFWDHWETPWKHRSVTSFILFLACEVEKTQHQDEIDNQRETFRRVGLKYDVWPASRIVRTLRPNPGIVSLFFEPVDYWLERICSQTINAPRSQIAAVTFQNEQLSTVLAGTVGTIAAQIDEAWREGRRRDARRLLANAVGSESSFRVLPNELQARLIRFEAISALEMGEPIARVEALAKRATLIEPASPGTSLLAALIQLHRQRPAEALAELQDINNIEALQLKASSEKFVG